MTISGRDLTLWAAGQVIKQISADIRSEGMYISVSLNANGWILEGAYKRWRSTNGSFGIRSQFDEYI